MNFSESISDVAHLNFTSGTQTKDCTLLALKYLIPIMIFSVNSGTLLLKWLCFIKNTKRMSLTWPLWHDDVVIIISHQNCITDRHRLPTYFISNGYLHGKYGSIFLVQGHVALELINDSNFIYEIPKR